MGKIAVVYWSGTGNTESMAEFVAEGIREGGAEAVVYTAGKFNPDTIDEYDAIAFGCPSMGAEVLEEDEFEPMFTSCEAKLQGKKIALFGSYGWGDGEWMRNWEARMNDCGATLVADGFINRNEPQADAIEALKDLGALLG